MQMPQRPHCPRCAGYEDKVMRRADGEELAASVKPCKDYAMSDRFRTWAVAQMQREVSGQVSSAGLDRMAVLKGPVKPANG
ncbi:MAG: hypothetical protein ABR562_06485 [Thermoplasmatota archaeon]